MSSKSDRKKMNAPDALQTKSIEMIGYLAQYKKPLSILGAVIICLFFIVFGVKSFLDHKTEARKMSLSKIDMVFGEEQKEFSEKREELQKKITELEQKSSKASADKKEAPQKDSEKLASLKKDRDNLEPVHDKSAEQYKGFYEANTGNSEGWIAGVKYSNYLIKKNKLSEALPVLESILEESAGYNFYQIHVRYMMVGVLEDLKKYDLALEMAEKLQKVAPKAIKLKAMLSKARILLTKNDIKSANTIFDEIIKEDSNSSEANLARSLKGLHNK